MSSPNIALNGNVLYATPEGGLPDLSPAEITDDTPVTIGPLSYGLFVFPQANAPACM
jgi:hypothetical protein